MFWLLLIKFRGEWIIECSSWDYDEMKLEALAARRNKSTYKLVGTDNSEPSTLNTTLRVYNQHF
jgi:hypothetical protein